MPVVHEFLKNEKEDLGNVIQETGLLLDGNGWNRNQIQGLT